MRSQFVVQNSRLPLWALLFRLRQNWIHLFQILFESALVRFGNYTWHAYSKWGWISALHSNLLNEAFKIFCYLQRNLNLEFILFTTLTAMLPPDRLQSKIHPKYFTSLCCFILISPLFISNLALHFNLLFVPKRMDFIFSSPKWILNLFFFMNQLHKELNILFKLSSISFFLFLYRWYQTWAISIQINVTIYSLWHIISLK